VFPQKRARLEAFCFNAVNFMDRSKKKAVYEKKRGTRRGQRGFHLAGSLSVLARDTAEV